MRYIGLFFGTFDPIHIGHLHIAKAAYTQARFHELWFVVTPHSPFKGKDSSLFTPKERWHLVKKVCDQHKYMRACDLELSLPSPQYTYFTLQQLQKQYPKNRFALVVGSDTFQTISHWREASWITQNYPLYVYLRKEEYAEGAKSAQVYQLSGPSLEISSTKVRQCIRNKSEITQYVPAVVWTSIYQDLLPS